MTAPVRFALVGCGVIARTQARALAAMPGDAELVACSDIDPARAQALAQEFGVTALPYADVLADPTIDAVTVCTPSGAHAEVGVPALEAGKHVLVEKPMEITLEACDRLLDAAERSGTVLAVVSQHRFDPASQAVAQAVADGELGRLLLAECRVPWFRTQEYYDSGDWRGTWTLDGGGALMNQGIHTLDLLRWLCGPVRTVYGATATTAHDRIEVEDVACATLTFADGALATLMASTGAYPGRPAQLAVHGTRGGAVIDGDRLALLAVHGEPERGRETAHPHARQVAAGGTRAATEALDARAVADDAPSDESYPWGEAHRRQMLDMVDAIRAGRTPLVDGPAGRAAVELVLAVYESARTGQPVHL